MFFPAPKIEVKLDFPRPRGAPGRPQEASGRPRQAPGGLQEAPGASRRPPGGSRRAPEASRGLPEGLLGLPGASWGLVKSRMISILGSGFNTPCPPVDKLLEIKKNKKAHKGAQGDTNYL